MHEEPRLFAPVDASWPGAVVRSKPREAMLWDRAVTWSFVIALTTIVLLELLAFVQPDPAFGLALARYFFSRQDAILLVCGLVLLKVVGVVTPYIAVRLEGARSIADLLQSTRVAQVVLTAFVLVTGLIGTFLVQSNYPVSIDEVMANFDATILANGHVVAPLGEKWRPFAEALSPNFTRAFESNAGWTSAYLPVNAAIRALFSLFSARALANPALAALAVWAIFGIARRLWPDRPDAAIVGSVLLATSSQVLFMSMTSYAMTAHLALNMVWLRCFLRQDRWGYAGAIATGALACGIHQVIFHPLFIAPFLLQLGLQRRWRLVLTFAGTYATIGLFWISYGNLAAAVSHMPLPESDSSALEGLSRTVWSLIGDQSFDSIELMMVNIVRFIAWQHIMVLPLLLIAFLSTTKCRHWPVALRAGAASIGLTLLVVGVLLPFQGHGWGYRYLHGLIGIVCLIAAFGWIKLVPQPDPRRHAQAWACLLGGTVAGLATLFVGQAVMIRGLTAPYARASVQIERASADVVIVDDLGLAYARDLVRNDPFLRNAPKVMWLGDLDDAQIRLLCRRYSVAIFEAAHGKAAGIAVVDRRRAPAVADIFDRRRALMTSMECGLPLPLPSR